jgi:hypothetical protein
MDMQCVYCEVGTEFLCITYIDTRLICLHFWCLNVADTVLYFFVQITQYTTVINLLFWDRNYAGDGYMHLCIWLCMYGSHFNFKWAL